MNSRNHWAVNWVDGMKINKSHFQEQEAYFNELASLLAESSLTDHTYGLLPSGGGSPEMELVVTSERVELRSCRAITRGGHLILVGPENNADLQRRMSDLMYGRDFSEADAWSVVLRLHPDDRMEIGTPNPDETPLRHPYTSVRMSLEVLPTQHLRDPGAYHHALPLAKILRGYQGIERERDYIPPVTSTLASDQLLQLHQHWKELLLTMEGDTFEIIKKIKDKHRNNQGNQLSADLLHLAQAVIRYINEHFDPYRVLLPSRPPLTLFLWFMSLARTIRNEVRLAGNSENMLSYMAHFIEGVSATDLMSFCNELCDQAYDHSDIRQMVERVNNFLGFITRLFAQLRELDYHQ
ncbi:MAG: hypothetical protein AAGA62_04275, partial [Bacteroidota bacterium]